MTSVVTCYVSEPASTRESGGDDGVSALGAYLGLLNPDIIFHSAGKSTDFVKSTQNISK